MHRCSVVLGLDPFLLHLPARDEGGRVLGVGAADLHAAEADLVRRAIEGVRLRQAVIGWQRRVVECFVSDRLALLTQRTNLEMRVLKELNPVI